MVKDKNLDLTIFIEDLLDQIHELQDFIEDSGLTEEEYIQWQKDKEVITYH
tara:strand:- start:68 stop:220 length:153 start_codon:yes stop_codon:yes gene_type:complete